MLIMFGEPLVDRGHADVDLRFVEVIYAPVDVKVQ